MPNKSRSRSYRRQTVVCDSNTESLAAEFYALASVATKKDIYGGIREWNALKLSKDGQDRPVS